MSNGDYNVVVIGGGVAGLHIAGLLGKEVGSVCLIDSKEDLLNISFYTLGSFIGRERFGLSERVIAAHITECALHSKHLTTTKRVDAYILDKKLLHAELLDRCRRETVAVKNATRIKGFKKNDDGTIAYITDDRGGIYRGKIFIDASGVAGVLSRPLGLQDQKFPIAVGLEYDVKYLGASHQAHLFIGKEFRGGYAWIFPLRNERAIFGYGTFDTKVVTRLKAVVNEVVSIPPISKLVKKDNDQPYAGTIPITKVKNKFVHKNAVCLGDSVSQVHPLIGEGYRFILEAGTIAAPHIANALREDDLTLLTGYEREWNSTFLASYRRGKFLQNTLKFGSHSDSVCDTLLFLISKLGDRTFMKILSGGV